MLKANPTSRRSDAQIVEELIETANRIWSGKPASSDMYALADELTSRRDAALGVNTDGFISFERWQEMILELDARLRPLLSLPKNHPNFLKYIHDVQVPYYRIKHALPRLGREEEAPPPAPQQANREGGANPPAQDLAPWPEYMTANDLAARLLLQRQATRKKLERLAKRIDCRREVESPRKGEAKWTYRVQTVLPELRK